MSQSPSRLDLYDFRLRVAAMYRERDRGLQTGINPEAVRERWRATRDDLFAAHPQSALAPDRRARFRGLRFFPYNPAAVVEATVEPAGEPHRYDVGTSGEGVLPMDLIATVHFSLEGTDCSLALYWIDVYGGGLFLPFHDRTAPDRSYGGGRYLVDTVKSSDLPPPSDWLSGRIVLDFNYAYNPSCAYDSRWACPLAPPENRLSVPIEAGEMLYEDGA